MTCHCASLADTTARFFDERRVRSELATYRRAGPRVTTKGLLGELTAAGQVPETLLDIGSGIGDPPLSPLHAAAQSERGGVSRVVGGVGSSSPTPPGEVPASDLVTLDRVVCCYPAYAPLLEQAAAHSRRLLAMSYPRDRWWVRAGVLAENAWFRLRGIGFRSYMHRPAAMTELLQRLGFTRVRAAATWTWQIEVYSRVNPRRWSS